MQNLGFYGISIIVTIKGGALMTYGNDITQVIKAVKLVAQIILENGGETYRVEDTVMRICRSIGIIEIEPMVMPTGLFITISQDGIDNHTIIKRVKRRTIDLTKVDAANRISRQITSGELNLEEAIIQLEKLNTTHTRQRLLPTLASALSSGFFTLLFNGSLFDFSIAALCGAMIQIIAFVFQGEDMSNFIINLIGGIIAASIAIASTILFAMGNMDLIISGAIMPLLPGLAMTNAIRDTMQGDLVSGVARGAEALTVAIALAVGVGVVLKAWIVLGGGLV